MTHTMPLAIKCDMFVALMPCHIQTLKKKTKDKRLE